jgi:hypothetical protein
MEAWQLTLVYKHCLTLYYTDWNLGGLAANSSFQALFNPVLQRLESLEALTANTTLFNPLLHRLESWRRWQPTLVLKTLFNPVLHRLESWRRWPLTLVFKHCLTLYYTENHGGSCSEHHSVELFITQIGIMKAVAATTTLFNPLLHRLESWRRWQLTLVYKHCLIGCSDFDFFSHFDV